MSSKTIRGQSQKAFVKIFDSICQWNSRWDRWNDMVTLFAIEISNAVDSTHRDERNERYAAVAKKYKPEEFERFAALFAEIVEEFERNPFQDFLGAMYMELEMGSSQNGQFFTPYNVCEMMAETAIDDEVLSKVEDHGWISVNDPTCGGGATLIAAAGSLYKRGINYQEKVLFIGQDLDQTVAMMCYIQLSLLGCAGYVHVGNTLSAPLTGDTLTPNGNNNTWYTPMYFSNLWAGRIIARRMDLALSGHKANCIKQQRNDNIGSEEEVVEPLPERSDPDGGQRGEDSGQPVQLSFF